ncbi:hypothetical protein Cch01nite_03590 [Cellulomonas chitinilytica]|uniref:Transglutaminase-like domain-containing protein n=1 Tax=Cellulomonas chitinilytica TaxID=398759 RepID=A0A919NZV1_9CELL|nr:transglutaminase-like domain-containing protein [Cellulomonas chitinilytica]GIG19635.1 hypothetical protein Cch01nite_03590 [Cellulomonas chitinilytica]
MPHIDAYAQHSPYSDPGPHGALLKEVEPTPPALHQAACATIVHYRGQASELAAGQDADIDLRWLSHVLDVATARVPGSLTADRPVHDRVAGCCRDHSLFAVAVLREHGIPARTRVGFAGYFEGGFHHDHVVAELWDGDRWVRFDPELDPVNGPVGGPQPWGFDIDDMPTGPGAPFQTAAEVWQQVRAGTVDPSVYGVDASMPELCGAEFVRGYVVEELAHRQREELLLWDVWGDTVPRDLADGLPPEEEVDALVDEVADLLVRADAGDRDAEAALDALYGTSPRLNPSAGVLTLSPTGRVGDTDLAARSTRWRP